MKIDQIIHTKRKTFAIVVKRDGSLIIRAPLNATPSQIEAVVEKKKTWINAKQEFVNRVYAKIPIKEYVNGEGFLFLDKSYKLTIVDNQKESLVLGDQFYLLRSAWPKAEEVFKAWYKKQALSVISQRVSWYASNNGFIYDKVKIMDAKTRWGSCGPKGSLNFSRRLVMAPMRVIDYVVIHEMVHLQEKNHSKSYWNKVKALMTDYPKQISWLDKYGHTLQL